MCITGEVPFEIPDSWEWIRLGSFISLTSGQDMTPDKYNSSHSGIPYITGASNIDNDEVIINRWTDSPKAIAYEGDLLLTCKGTVGTMAFLKEKQVHIARQVMAISSPFGVNLRFVRLYLDSYVTALKTAAKSMIPGISRTDVSKILFPLPPENEQIRILQKHDDLVQPIIDYNNAEQRTKELNDNFPEKLKKSILQWAVQGKLVPQDPSDEPASILLEHIREEKDKLIKEGEIKKDKIESTIFRRDNSHYEKIDGKEVCIDSEIPFELPESWQWERLVNLYRFIDYRGTTPNKIGDGIPFVTAKNVKCGFVDYTVRDYISEEDYNHRQSRGISHRGDILFTTEAPLGNAALADLDKYSAGQRLITLQQYSKDCLNNTLFMFFILSECFQSQLVEQSTGTTVKGIKADKLKRLLLPVPPKREQNKIVDAINRLMDMISSM